MAWYESLLLFGFLAFVCFGFYLSLRSEFRFRRILEQRDRAITKLCYKLIEDIDRESYPFED